VPLRPKTAERLHRVYLAKGAQATTAIEGNSLSEAEVLDAVDGKLKVPPSKEYLKQEVENIIEACNAIGQQVASDNLPPVTPELIAAYNKQVLKNLPLSEEVVPGASRKHSVVVGRVYRGAPPEDCDYLLARLCDWLAEIDREAPKGREIVYAVIKAVLTHLYIAWIHPFGDGNGRTARLLEFHILMSAGIPTPAAHLLSNHYNQTRSEYYRQLDLASKSGGEVLPFVLYAVGGYVDQLRVQLDDVWSQQWEVAWENYVHDALGDRPRNQRQHHLAIDLGNQPDWVQVSAIPELTPRLAKAYSGRTSKTVQRDLTVLAKLQLVDRIGRRRVRARKEAIYSFLPVRKN
jgi:Fic family protein